MTRIKIVLILAIIISFVSCSSISNTNGLYWTDLFALEEGMSSSDILSMGFELFDNGGWGSIRDNNYSMGVKIYDDLLYAPTLFFNTDYGLIGYFFHIGIMYSDLSGSQIKDVYIELVDSFEKIFGFPSSQKGLRELFNSKLASALYLETVELSASWNTAYGTIELRPYVMDISLDSGASFYVSCFVKFNHYDYCMNGDTTRYPGPFGLEMGCTKEEFINSGLGYVSNSYLSQTKNDNVISIDCDPVFREKEIILADHLYSIDGRFSEKYGLGKVTASYFYHGDEKNKQLDEFYAFYDTISSQTGVEPEIKNSEFLGSEEYAAYWRIESSNNNEIRFITVRANLKGFTIIEFQTIADRDIETDILFQ